MPCFEIWRFVARNNFTKPQLMLRFSKHLKLSTLWCFKIWSCSESNTILCPFFTRSGNFFLSFSQHLKLNILWCFKIWSRSESNTILCPFVTRSGNFFLSFSQHLKLNTLWCFKIWSCSESNTILCPFVTRSGNFSLFFFEFLQKHMKHTLPTQRHEILGLVAGRNKFHGTFVSCYVTINSVIRLGVYWPRWTLFCCRYNRVSLYSGVW